MDQIEDLEEDEAVVYYAFSIAYSAPKNSVSSHRNSSDCQ
jgi:hypothetical protein